MNSNLQAILGGIAGLLIGVLGYLGPSLVRLALSGRRARAAVDRAYAESLHQKAAGDAEEADRE